MTILLKLFQDIKKKKYPLKSILYPITQTKQKHSKIKITYQYLSWIQMQKLLTQYKQIKFNNK